MIKKTHVKIISVCFKLLKFVGIFYIAAYCATSIYIAFFYNNGDSYVYTKKTDPTIEELRLRILKNMSVVDRLFIIYANYGVMDSLEMYQHALAENNTQLAARLLIEVEKLGTCDLQGKRGSYYVYADTETIFRLYYKTISFYPCKESFLK